MAKRVAVIGAGVSGLSSIKCCLDEDLEPICFERSSDIGGLWKFTETSEDGMTRVYKSLVTNVCKEMSCYSDFPFQEDYPNFMNQEKFWNYLQEFAEYFDLLKYIRFKTTVRSITKRPDFSETGQWDVVTETEGRQVRAVFDAVMVCTGHFLNPRLPLESFPGIHKFQGQILHSQEYKIPAGFQGKRVLVIGLGNTGGDIAVELSRTAAQVLLSTRTGTWVINRSSDGGYPFNMMVLRRHHNFIAQVLPSCILKWIQERRLNKRFNHANYGLRLCKIPPSQKLMAEAMKKEQLIERGLMKDPGVDKLDYISYLDDLASFIGVKPNVPLLFIKDPRLAWEVFFGPCTPYQYRLMGPGKWDGARNAILTQWDRTLKPLKTRTVPGSFKPASVSHYLKAWGAPILLASLLLIYKSSIFLKLVPEKLQDRISPY
ncbi:dimethylaniline monooxygenase [N-oxide-forming] 4 isoform X2 [Cervus elaphus]|uniref:dimethylaniline monooxygenase [N-oxide-forming] 4 isoform X2 n=1 Tax=Cervus elaphus TaxID=9860 RepID=UPI001CC2DEF1|nr:dimethylaniline monooxygenase [N-oxide-forming] 4 isoform X2 [Cervus elaphus]